MMVNAMAASVAARSKIVTEKEKPMQAMKIGTWLGFVLVPVLTLGSIEAAAQTACNPRTDVLRHLATKYGEAPVAIGVTNKGGLVEVLTTGDGNTWTIIVSQPNGTSCMVAAGEGWRTKDYDAAELAPAT